MSGILAVLRTDGAPVSSALVERLTRSMELRGPDAQKTWCQGPIGLGHTLLRTTYEAQHERQPFTLDGHVVIAADGRVDARNELIEALGPEHPVSKSAPDVELMLRAYHRWGDRCVEHLLGDFAFAVWDGPRRRLFCARDHMGVKPFYYAHVGRWLLVSSAIETLRLHPEVSDTLNDLAVADFLMFGFNQENSTTTFQDIQRLPPAHTLAWSDGDVSVKRYWTLPIEEPVYHRRDSDYVDEFKELVLKAVNDRLRVDRVGVFMSGGLDSPMLAATAKKALQSSPAPDPVHAFTFSYATLFRDPEREQADIVARYLDVPIHHYSQDERVGWFPEHCERYPEPCLASLDHDPERRCYEDLAAHSRVAFYGEGPDNALRYEWRSHLGRLHQARRFGRMISDIAKHVVAHRRVPLLPTIPRMVRERRDQDERLATFPTWLESGLVERLDLTRRWSTWCLKLDSSHPWRPIGYASLLIAQWQVLFEGAEPSYSCQSLEVRHPFVDIRVLRCMLRVPALPWCRSKHLVRVALRGEIPEKSRCRAKAPLAGDPCLATFKRIGAPELGGGARCEKYGALESFRSDSPADVQGKLRLVGLAHWLDRRARGHSGNVQKENASDTESAIAPVS